MKVVAKKCAFENIINKCECFVVQNCVETRDEGVLEMKGKRFGKFYTSYM